MALHAPDSKITASEIRGRAMELSEDGRIRLEYKREDTRGEGGTIYFAVQYPNHRENLGVRMVLQRGRWLLDGVPQTTY